MDYLPPFWIPGTHRLEVNQLNDYGKQYRELLIGLRDDQYSPEKIHPVNCLNDLLNNN
jgi:glutathione-regulated potassium-efflux system ancillary protein KefG